MNKKAFEIGEAVTALCDEMLKNENDQREIYFDVLVLLLESFVRCNVNNRDEFYDIFRKACDVIKAIYDKHETS